MKSDKFKSSTKALLAIIGITLISLSTPCFAHLNKFTKDPDSYHQGRIANLNQLISKRDNVLSGIEVDLAKLDEIIVKQKLLGENTIGLSETLEDIQRLLEKSRDFFTFLTIGVTLFEVTDLEPRKAINVELIKRVGEFFDRKKMFTAFVKKYPESEEKEVLRSIDYKLYRLMYGDSAGWGLARELL